MYVWSYLMYLPNIKSAYANVEKYIKSESTAQVKVIVIFLSRMLPRLVSMITKYLYFNLKSIHNLS